jgi:ABC-type dipeptide/oligopeptide/nickel transport system permease subunit
MSASRVIRHRFRFMRLWSARIGVALLIFVIGVALVGPLVAPHSPTAIAGIPFSAPSGRYPLGIDFNGRDVLSRVLHGGLSVLTVALTATLLAYMVGGTVGLVAGHSRRRRTAALMRFMDLLLAFPPLLFLLVLATGAGPGIAPLLVGIAVVQLPGIARVVRAATLEVSVRGYIEAAIARGERSSWILFRETLPNILNPIIADAGPRFTVSVLLVAAVNFIGLGLQPPASDWALMISENRGALTVTPLTVSASVFVPALLIAALTVGANLVGNAVAQSAGISADPALTRR